MKPTEVEYHQRHNFTPEERVTLKELVFVCVAARSAANIAHLKIKMLEASAALRLEEARIVGGQE